MQLHILLVIESYKHIIANVPPRLSIGRGYSEKVFDAQHGASDSTPPTPSCLGQTAAPRGVTLMLVIACLR